MLGILGWLIIGGIAGWLVGKVVKGSGYGIVGDIVVGIIGGIIGGFIAGLIFPGFDMNAAFDNLGAFITTIIVAFIGGAILMFIVGAVMGRGKSTANDMAKSTSDMAKSTTDTMKSTASSATDMTKNAAAGATGAAGAAGASTMAAAGAAGAATMAAAGGAASMTKDAAGSAGGAAAGATAAAMGAMGGMNMDQMMGALNDVMSGKPLDANSALGQMITPMADGITAKLGLPKGVGAMVVAFALSKLGEWMNAKMGKGPMPAGMPAGTTPDQVLGKISSGQGMDASSLQSMGLTSELAKKTGLSDSQASQGLEMAMGALSAGMSGQKSYQGMNLPDMSMLTGMMKA